MSVSRPIPTPSKLTGSFNLNNLRLKTASLMTPLRGSLVPAIPLRDIPDGKPPRYRPPSEGASISFVPRAKRVVPISISSSDNEIL